MKKLISLHGMIGAFLSLMLLPIFGFADNKVYRPTSASPCLTQIRLNDGFYVGVQAGYDTYRVVDDTSTAQLAALTGDGPVNLDPRLAVNGAVGGVNLGYGKYLLASNKAYLGIEIFGNKSAANSNGYEFYVVTPDPDIYKQNVKVTANYGASILPGFKINNATLLYLRLGYNWAKFKISEYYEDTIALPPLNFSDSKKTTRGGFQYGVGLESAVAAGWSVRAEYNHTGFKKFEDDAPFDSEFAASDNQFMLGLLYHIKA